MRLRSLLLLGSICLVAACGSTKPKLDNSQFWQRISVADSLHQRGPKAQQALNRDIARCVTELRELERLGAVKNAIPADVKGRVLNPDEKQLADWNTPERDENLYAEHSDYHDFEGCMQSKGWERVTHAPFDVAEKARNNYKKSHIDYAYKSRIGDRHDAMSKDGAPGYNYSTDYSNVNQ